MATWRYKISLLVFNDILQVRAANVKYFTTLKEKFQIPMQPYNIIFYVFNLRRVQPCYPERV